MNRNVLKAVIGVIVAIGIIIGLILLLKPSKSTENYQTLNITKNGYSVPIMVDKPEGDELNVLLVFHGTNVYDKTILDSTKLTLTSFKDLLTLKNFMIISVAYPEENILIGDSLVYCEAALLWVKENASSHFNVKINKIFLAGHSQGAYQVTRLNVLHETDGVVANAPGPLDLLYRCELDEKIVGEKNVACGNLRKAYGSTSVNPEAYRQRSLMNFTSGYKSDILFFQGLDDQGTQMTLWPKFREKVAACTNCKNVAFLELQRLGHTAIFESELAKKTFNDFLSIRLVNP